MFSFNCWGAGTNGRADGPAFLWYSTRLTGERNAICAALPVPRGLDRLQPCQGKRERTSRS